MSGFKYRVLFFVAFVFLVWGFSTVFLHAFGFYGYLFGKGEHIEFTHRSSLIDPGK